MSYKRVSACVSLFVWVSFVSVGAVLSIFLLNIKIPSSPACSRKKISANYEERFGGGVWTVGLRIIYTTTWMLHKRSFKIAFVHSL